MKNNYSNHLHAKNITVNFGGVLALDHVVLIVNSEEVLGLIGPNGSGKTTLFNVISGFISPNSGNIIIDDLDITYWPAYKRSRNGIVRTFQDVRLFQHLTVFENILAGALGNGYSRREADKRTQEILELMDLQTIQSVATQILPPGFQRRIAIARAIATLPNFLLLDEPGAGLNEAEIDELITVLKMIRTHNK